MSQENCSAASPFSALTYQEQQDKWLEWRSRQLDYRPAQPGVPQADVRQAPAQQKGEADQAPPELPMLKIPNMLLNAPTGRRELNQVLARHAQAARRAGAYQTTSID